MTAATLFDGLYGRLATVRSGRLLSSGAFGLADQALTSLANFVTMVLVARSLGPESFGTFLLVYMALLFAGSVQAALITRPHNVLAASLSSDEFKSYTSGAARAQVLLAAGFAALALLAAGGAALGGLGSTALLLALAAAVFCWQLQEFVRQVQYTRDRPAEAFVYDLISYGGQIGLIVLLWATDALTGVDTLYAVAVTSLLSAVYGFWRLRLVPWRPSIRLGTGASAEVVSRNWRFGKWLLADGIGLWLSTQMYPLMAAAIVGVTATATLKAIQTIVAPVHVILNSYTVLALPRAAAAFSRGGKKALFVFLVPASVLFGLPYVAYLAAVSLLGVRLMSFLYPGYHAEAAMVWLWCLEYMLVFVAQAVAVGLMALGDTRAMFVGRLASIFLTMTLGIWLIQRFQVYGALVAGVLTVVAQLAVLSYCFVQARESGSWQPGEEAKSRLTPAGAES